jgi:predicted acylesterase/phospholipase RssA
LDLVEVLMASTAFPIVFPPVTISHAATLPDNRFIDGGAGDDYIPYKAVLEFEQYRETPVNKMLIVGRKMGNNETFAMELSEMGIEHYEWFNRVGISIEDIEKKALIKRLQKIEKESPGLAAKTYLLIPDFPENYTMFDFNNMREQYATARKWARANKPVPLNDFLLNFKDD